MNTDQYKTIATKGEGLYKEKGSKFIGVAIPVKSSEDVENAIDTIKKQYHDARHHCYAYCLGKKGDVFRSNDDGEPKHSAGDPILGQIRARDLTDVLVVVIRYFGGTKLGIGGLIKAYKTAAACALIEAKVVIDFEKISLDLRCAYENLDQVMKLVSKYDMSVLGQNFDLNCTLRVELRRSFLDALKKNTESFLKISEANREN
jgi:uncharacterized YigZ family protein